MSETGGSMSKAWSLWHAGNVQGAEDELRLIVGADPENSDALALLAMCRSMRKDSDEARALIERAVAEDGENDFAWRLLGIILDRDEKKYSEAEEALLKAVSLAPGDSYHHLALANFYERRQKKQQAEAAYVQGLNLDSDNAALLTDYGSFLIDKGRAGEAMALIERANAIAPDNAELILLLGEIAFRKGDMTEARERALWVLSQDAENREALTLLTKVKARRNPVMGVWMRWAMFMNRFSGKAQLGIILGLWLVYQVAARTFLPSLPVWPQRIIMWSYLGFVLMTWIAPYIFARMVQAEMKDVTIKDEY